MFEEITVDTFRENPTPENTAELIVALVKDRDSWKEQAHEATMLAGQLAAEKRELQDQVAKWTEYAAALTLGRNKLQEENRKLTTDLQWSRAVNLTLQEKVENLSLERNKLLEENQKLRDAALHAPFAKYEVYEDD